MIEQQNLNQWLKEEVAVRTAELRRERASWSGSRSRRWRRWSTRSRQRIAYQRGHSARVADMGAMIASELAA